MNKDVFRICATKSSDFIPIHENGIWGNGLYLCWPWQDHETPTGQFLLAASHLTLIQKVKKPFEVLCFPLKMFKGRHIFSSPQHFNGTFGGFSLVGALDDASDTTIFKRENIVTISFRQKGALLCFHTSRDQCSEHSHVKWRFSLHKECFSLRADTEALSAVGSALDKHSFVLWECRETDRREAGRQAESERRAEAVGSSAVSSGMPRSLHSCQQSP